MQAKLLLRGAVGLIVCLAMVSSVRAAGVIFRYLPGQPDLSSQVALEHVEVAPYAAGAEGVARGDGGWGWPAPSAARLMVPQSTLHSTEERTYFQPTGLQLTTEAWFQVEVTSEAATLLTNRTQGAEGFTMGLSGGRPYLEVQIGEERWRVTAERQVAAGQRYWLAATARHAEGMIQLRLYVNGREAARHTADVTISSFYRLSAPFYVGTRVEGEPEAPQIAGSLDGYLFGALVRDYVARESYLTSSVPFDGSTYFGLPVFYDHPVTSTQLPSDQRIDASQTPVRHRFFLPYVNDEYIPQGTATHLDVRDGDTTALVYVAYYHRTRSDQHRTRKSIIAEIDAETGHVRRTFRLQGTLDESHVGGIAYSHGALFVSSSSRLERYPLPDYEGPDAPKYYDLPADNEGSIRVDSRASYVSSFRDTLWVGEWHTNDMPPPRLSGYPLGEDGRPIRGAEPVVVPIPRYVQGVDFFERGGTTYTFLSKNISSARGEAGIMRFRWSVLRSAATAPEPDTTIIVPHGIEDLSFFPDGTLWTNSESGADFYQRAEEWPTFYPFVYSLPADAVLPGGTSTGTTDTARPTEFGLESFPNPFAGAASITLTLPRPEPIDVGIFDALGRRVATLASGLMSAGVTMLHWQADGLAPGHYFVVAEGTASRVVHPVVLAR